MANIARQQQLDVVKVQHLPGHLWQHAGSFVAHKTFESILQYI
jgi:hypothetical protein